MLSELLMLRLFDDLATMTSYLTKFLWDMAKFPTKQPLKNITDQITKVI